MRSKGEGSVDVRSSYLIWMRAAFACRSQGGKGLRAAWSDAALRARSASERCAHPDRDLARPEAAWADLGLLIGRASRRERWKYSVWAGSLRHKLLDMYR